jgi:hypothetical protein
VEKKSDHSIVKKMQIDNTGFLEDVDVEREVNISADQLEFVITAAYCFKFGDECNAWRSDKIEAYSLYPPLTQTPTPEAEMPLFWYFILGGIGIVGLTLAIVMIVLCVRRFRKQKATKTHERSLTRKRKDRNSAYLSEGLVEMEA